MFPEPDSTELGNLLKRLTTRSGTLMSSHKNLIELLEHIWSWLFWFILINTPTGFWEQSHRLQSKACWETPVEESPFSVKSQVRRTNMGFRKRKPEASAGLLPGLREGTSPSLHPYIRKNWNYRNGETTGALEEPGATSSTLGSTQKVVLSLRRGFLMNGG